MSTNKYYTILVGQYAKNHYIKPFKKKYKNIWDKTYITIESLLSHIEVFSKTSKVNKIHICDSGYIAKCEFNIEGTRISTKASGNRLIIYVNENTSEINILLVYAKTNIKGNNETSWWENEIKNNYKDIYEIFEY